MTEWPNRSWNILYAWIVRLSKYYIDTLNISLIVVNYDINAGLIFEGCSENVGILF